MPSAAPAGVLTFLFTDLENSTLLWERFPESMQSVLAQHDALLKQVVEAYHGRIVKTTGDGLHAVFASPVDGITAALAGQKALLSAAWPEGISPLKVRMGLHTGISQERDGDYFGQEVNLAARIMGLSHGGQILLSEVTTRLVEKAVPPETAFADLGEHRLKGIAGVERIFQLIHPDLRAEFPPLQSLETFKHNLPRQLSTFIGRKQELAEIKRLVKTTSLLTLIGPGGTGKTRLMLQAAEEMIADYPDGVWLVELAPLSDPALIPERVAAAFGIKEQPGRSMLDTLVEYLRRKELLILLDNVEHLVAASAELCTHLMRNCPRLRLLVTSREALFVEGEITLNIPSLSLPGSIKTLSTDELRASESVQLFLERACAVKPDFNLTAQNAAVVAEVVLRLDGIPLALELAAARLRMLTIEQIALRLNDRFRLLTGGHRTAIPRQQTLQALFDWSWFLLEGSESVLLRRLSIFTSGWNLEAAQKVCGFDPLDEFDVFDRLEQLINKSLVTVEHLSDGEARYGMLESIRQYAYLKLDEAGEVPLLRDRHADYFIALVDTYASQGAELDYYAWIGRFTLEADNLRAVVEWIAKDRPGITLRFTSLLLQYEAGWLHLSEERSWLEAAIERARLLLEENSADIRLTDYIRALRSLGWLLVTHGDMTNGHAFLDESMRLARQHGEIQLLALALSMKAQAMGYRVTQEIIDQLLNAIELCRRNGYELELTYALYSTSQALFIIGDFEAGRKVFAEVVERIEEKSLLNMKSWVYALRAVEALLNREFSNAERYYLIAIKESEKLRDQRMLATFRSDLAHIYRQLGRLDEAAAIYRQTILSWQEQGHPGAVAHQLECFAYIAIAASRFSDAAQLLGAAQHTRQRTNSPSTEQKEINEKDQALARLEVELGREELNRRVKIGESMNLDQAVEFALRLEQNN